MDPVRVWRKLQRWGGVALLAAALSGCMTMPPPVAMNGTPVAARADLDQGAYGVTLAQASVTPVAYAREGGYRLDAGDRLRIVVFGQEGLTNS